MLLLFSISTTANLGKSCLFGLPCVFFRERLTIRVCAFFPIGFEGGIWDMFVIVPSLSFLLYGKSFREKEKDLRRPS